MQSITRQEIALLIHALNDRAQECAELLQAHQQNKVACSPVLLNAIERESQRYQSIAQRLQIVLLDADGRIAVE